MYYRGDENHQQENRCNTSPGDFPEPSGLATNHELDILANVANSIDPHEANALPKGNPKDGKSSTISVHQVQNVLSSISCNSKRVL